MLQSIHLWFNDTDISTKYPSFAELPGEDYEGISGVFLEQCGAWQERSGFSWLGFWEWFSERIGASHVSKAETPENPLKPLSPEIISAKTPPTCPFLHPQPSCECVCVCVCVSLNSCSVVGKKYLHPMREKLMLWECSFTHTFTLTHTHTHSDRQKTQTYAHTLCLSHTYTQQDLEV